MARVRYMYYASSGKKITLSLNQVIVRRTKIMNRADKTWVHLYDD